MRKPIIFTSFNDDVDERFYHYQRKILEKLGIIQNYTYAPLKYNFHHSDMLHGDVLNKFVNKIFYEQGFDAIMIIDIDCIPLSKFAVDYTFELAYNGMLVGNIQRSSHINNNNHLYCASSFICFTEKTYRELGRPNFLPNYDGDTCEQLTYNAEKIELPVIAYLPTKIERPNENYELWDLGDRKFDFGLPKYGIGTTFSQQIDDKIIPMTYHLFGSRLKQFDELFFSKCERILSSKE